MPHPAKDLSPGPDSAARVPVWAWLMLLLVIALDVWLRGHTFAPEVRRACGLDPYLVASAEGEPIDCDEAIYAYYGRRIVGGAVLYRDLAEPKPPGGYWLYAGAVRLGRADEATVRWLAVPIVAGTLLGVWGVALRLAGPLAATLAALGFALASTDPYLHGNGSNLEHPINLLATTALAILVWNWSRRGRWAIVGAGIFLGMACLFKQVAVTHLLVAGGGLLLRRGVGSRRWGDMVALGLGFGLPLALAMGVLVVQGAGRAAYEQVVVYGSAMAARTPAPPHSPPGWFRLLVGNTDPRSGALPWPFGETDWLRWWGSGIWPFWLLGVPCWAWLGLGRGDERRRLVAAWGVSAVAQVALPGLYWAHYYLLPLPGLAIALGVAGGDLVRGGRWRFLRWLGFLGVLAALAGTAGIEVRDYLWVPADQLGTRYKGGRQWGGQRALGRELKRLMAGVPGARLFVWGTSSPLYVHSGMDGVTPFSFADPLMQAEALSHPDDPLIRPRLDRILRDLRSRPPEVVFVADPPFPGLAMLLNEQYRRVPRLGPVWIRKNVPLPTFRPR